ncbi:MAG: AAA family ATPase [Oscillospiraceae bacterium]|jgi:chromosome segregation protein|nr:AAA family ATPase [Oscillospiraceae bacterium]
MYLKALELQGFKSFPDKLALTFDKPLTVIVGPNGSGKSNISDAILWVMGEQRTKTLRGGKMEDVIFGGTQARPKMGFAQVSLILDNSDKTFDTDFSELMLTRRYYRSGESEYYVNREPVRLKDVTELLMDTGLGRYGYSIIGQGRISEIVSAKSADRRELFEEAAGIARYRHRKDESERKLERTQENLVRINDKLDELALQVDPLREQAETAKKYLVLRDELRLLEVSLWLQTLDSLAERTRIIDEDWEKARADAERAKLELGQLYADRENFSERMREKDRLSERLRESIGERERGCAALESALAVLDNTQSLSLERQAQLGAERDEQSFRAQTLKRQIDEGTEHLSELEQRRSQLLGLTESADARSSLPALRNIIDGHKMRLSSRERLAASLREKSTALTIELGGVRSRVQLLSSLEREYEGYSKAVKTVMREASRGALTGVHGPVANLVSADERFALAIETALGSAMQNIVVDTQEQGKSAIERLKRLDAGRATFLPLSVIKPFEMKRRPDPEDGFLGTAFELARFDGKYESVFANLLGRVAVAENMGDALRISKKFDNQLRIVTLDGQLINAGGSMTGGSAARGTGIISRANELRQLEEQKKKLEAASLDNARELREAERELTLAGEELAGAVAEMNSLERALSALESESAATSRSIERLRELFDSLMGDDLARASALEAIERERQEIIQRRLKTREELDAAVEECDRLKRELQEQINDRLELEARRTRSEKQAQDKNNRLLDLERVSALAEQKKLAAEMEEKQLLDKLWDNYELSRTAAANVRIILESVSGANRRIGALKREISLLGTPNLGAIEEFERVSGRYNFMTEQRDDVERAKSELEKLISEISAEMEKIFSREFALINASFQETFQEFFGGGAAKLLLDDETDILGCGIEIKVQPPGKALTTLSLLSGGETALVAIALYFAVLKVRPSPFCVMDEIDAALDETNVDRFARQLRGLADQTQFVVITHRRGTMEEADLLCGVTMREKGVSEIIGLDLDQATKEIEA